MAYSNRKFTWDFDALKRFYERYVVKWWNSDVSLTNEQKAQARENLGISADNTGYDNYESMLESDNVNDAINELSDVINGSVYQVSLPQGVAGYYDQNGSVVSDTDTVYYNKVNLNAGYVYVDFPEANNNTDSYVLLYDANNNIKEKHILNESNKHIQFTTRAAYHWQIAVSCSNNGTPTIKVRQTGYADYNLAKDQTYYVSPIGDDSNDGLTPATPLKTINNAIYKGASKMVLRDGSVYYIFNESIDIRAFENKDVSIVNFPGETPRIANYTILVDHQPLNTIFMGHFIRMDMSSEDADNLSELIVLDEYNGSSEDYKNPLMDRSCNIILTKYTGSEIADRTDLQIALLAIRDAATPTKSQWIYWNNEIFYYNPAKEGSTREIQQQTVCAPSAIEIIGANKVFLSGLTFLYSGLCLQNCSNVHIEKCISRDSIGDGFFVEYCSYSEFKDCKAINPRVNGYYSSHSYTRTGTTHLENCYSYRAVSGVSSEEGTLTLSGGIFEYNTNEGIHSFNQNLYANNVTVQKCGTYGIKMDEDDVASYAKLEGCIVTDTVNDGYYASNAVTAECYRCFCDSECTVAFNSDGINMNIAECYYKSSTSGADGDTAVVNYTKVS